MAEVKAYKCDVCREVYHVEEGDKELMHIALKSNLDSEDIEKRYDHICLDCTGEIGKVIENPKIIKDLLVERDRASMFEHWADVFRDKLDKWKFATQLSFGAWAGVIIALLIIWCL